MERREFFQTCVGGFAVDATSLAFARSSRANGPAKKEWAVDPDELAGSVRRYFLPEKRTCCEAIVMAGCECLSVESDIIPDIALGLTGGVGLQGETCGAITGAAMVLSLAVAQKESDYKKKKMEVFSAAGRLCKKFGEEFGATDCRSLCGLDLTTEQGRKDLEEVVKEEKCAELVETAARLLAKELRDIQLDLP